MKIDIKRMTEQVWKIAELFGDEDRNSFLAVIAMALEEKCRDYGMDMVETCEMLLESAKAVNEQFGKY